MALAINVTDKFGNRNRVAVFRMPFRIGRSSENDLCLEASTRVSRYHAVVTADHDRYVLEILGKNPSFLNGTLMSAGSSTEIVDGDSIGFPEYALKVLELDAADPAHTTETFAIADGAGLMEQMVASSIGMPSFSADSFQHWLAAHPKREVRIFHDRLELTLASELGGPEVSRRMQSFEHLLVNPQNVLIEVHDPLALGRHRDRG